MMRCMRAVRVRSAGPHVRLRRLDLVGWGECTKHSSAAQRTVQTPNPKIYRRLPFGHFVTSRNAMPRDEAVSALKRGAKRRMLARFLNGARDLLQGAAARRSIPKEHHVYFRHHVQWQHLSGSARHFRSKRWQPADSDTGDHKARPRRWPPWR